MDRWYRTIKEIKTANKKRGNNWFEPDTLIFFKSRIYDHVYKGKYFISSEQGPDSIRKYSIRICRSDGKIDTVGEFEQYRTLGEAKVAVKLL